MVGTGSVRRVSPALPNETDRRLVAVDDAVEDDDLVAAVAAVVAGRVVGAVGHLRRRLQRPISATARTAIVVGIIRLGEDALLKEVARALRHDDVVVVVGAARILGLVGDLRAVPNLVDALKTDDVVVGAAVIDALGQLGDPACLPWLIAALEHRFCVVACCRALGFVGDEGAVELLRKGLDDDDDALRFAAAQALVRLQERGVG